MMCSPTNKERVAHSLPGNHCLMKMQLHLRADLSFAKCKCKCQPLHNANATKEHFTFKMQMQRTHFILKRIAADYLCELRISEYLVIKTRSCSESEPHMMFSIKAKKGWFIFCQWFNCQPQCMVQTDVTPNCGIWRSPPFGTSSEYDLTIWIWVNKLSSNGVSQNNKDRGWLIAWFKCNARQPILWCMAVWQGSLWHKGTVSRPQALTALQPIHRFLGDNFWQRVHWANASNALSCWMQYS